MISAKIIADSKNQQGDRLTTFVLTMPRIVLAKFNTHRMFSRNSASSRAIPFNKMVKMVEENPFIPLKWQKDHPGMQGTEYFTESDHNYTHLPQRWLSARDEAVRVAKALSKDGVTKQLCNCLLEPFMYHTVIVTATDYQNFFHLRASDAAEIHIQDLAYKMLDAYNTSEPKLLMPGQWHIPFGDNIHLPSPIPIPEDLTLDEGVELRKMMVATARCARVSYNNFEGKDDYDADINLYHRLLSSGHMSPFEHCAQAMTNDEYESHVRGVLISYGMCNCCGDALDVSDDEHGWCGNFRGFIQLRKTISGENMIDSRVINK